MKKLLKVLWANYYFILGLIFIIMAWWQPSNVEGLILFVLAVGCWILQKVLDIKEKLDQMELLYLQHEVLNAEASLALTKAIIKYTDKEDK